MLLKKGLIAGLVLFIFGMAVNWLMAFLFPSLTAEYQNGNIFRPWTDPLMTAYFAHPFIFGIVAAYLWNLLKDKIKGTKPREKALGFANIYFLIATVPGMFITYTSFKLSLLMVLSWVILGYFQAFIAGLVFVKMKK